MSGAPEKSTERRLRQAIIGCSVTLLPLLLVAGLHLSFLPKILVATYGLDREQARWAVSEFWHEYAASHAFPLSLVILHWVLSAAMGRGDLLKVRSANLTLALSIISFAFAVLLASVAPPPFNEVCAILGISQTDWPFGFDTQSSCERYSLLAAGSLAVVLPPVLIAVSAVLRILISRRRWRIENPLTTPF
ncbi:hypothetical protein [Alteriqipengyuania lutimaris]|uniref:hypothetical protein n=1 Tax=Alteriqipengyuania lutimaris TaxID=1538146 RepID=UPI0011C01E8A|nr:hypothetical protein [Alteriqipengyuania lutimaris]MBB3033135.1 hypothetical protein [Alteriqipengyuania lutimaris]